MALGPNGSDTPVSYTEMVKSSAGSSYRLHLATKGCSPSSLGRGGFRQGKSLSSHSRSGESWFLGADASSGRCPCC